MRWKNEIPFTYLWNRPLGLNRITDLLSSIHLGDQLGMGLDRIRALFGFLRIGHCANSEAFLSFSNTFLYDAPYRQPTPKKVHSNP